MYTKEYYEEGVAKGISGYTNYSWQPELTIPLAHRLIKRLGLNETTTVLDYGCAKGFLVKALRLLDVPAYGCDVSDYAISQVDPNYAKYCDVGGFLETDRYDWIIAKDTLEHLDVGALSEFESKASKVTSKIFIVVPLGDGSRYVIPQYENDITHVLRETLSWWISFFSQRGWTVEASTDMRGLKDSWAHYKDGNAALLCWK